MGSSKHDHPARTEEGIFEGAVACMQPIAGRRYSELWALYILVNARPRKKIKIITAWRYPGKAPERDPVPSDILNEIKNLR